MRKAPEGSGEDTEETGARLTRGDLLKAAAATAAGLALGIPPAASARRPRVGRPRGRSDLSGMNVVVFLSDQERRLQHFPRNWARDNLPGYTQLQANGPTFHRATTNACMCSPARSTLLTGYFPAQHGVKYTLESDMPADQYPQIELSTEFPNIATVMAAAGYDAVYKGKFHCVKAAAGGENWVPEDVNQYGFTRWNPPDAGANQDADQAGGGSVNNDGRYVYVTATWRPVTRACSSTSTTSRAKASRSA